MCLQLELQSTGPSTPSIIMDEEGNIIDNRDGGGEPIQFVFEDIHWTSEMSRQEATRRLEVTFYPFKKVTTWEAFIQHIYSTHCLHTGLNAVSFTTVSLFLSYSFPGVLPAFLRSLWPSCSRE